MKNNLLYRLGNYYLRGRGEVGFHLRQVLFDPTESQEFTLDRRVI